MKHFVATATLVLGAYCATQALAATCRYPPPASNYAPEDFSGTWYEIGRIQTAGGAIFQQNCVCTQVLVGQFDNAGDGNVTYSCREYTTKGSFLNFTGQLTEFDNQAGHFYESFFPGVNLNYTVIYVDADSALEYDCTDPFGLGSQYCVHVMSRTPTMPATKLQSLLTFAASLDLNTGNLPFNQTLQQGCW